LLENRPAFGLKFPLGLSRARLGKKWGGGGQTPGTEIEEEEERCCAPGDAR
jgi:hypothetical protein